MNSKPTPAKPTPVAIREDTLYPYLPSRYPAGSPMRAYAMKFKRFPSCDAQLLRPNWNFTITPRGFCRPVTNAIMKNRMNIIRITGIYFLLLIGIWFKFKQEYNVIVSKL